MTNKEQIESMAQQMTLMCSSINIMATAIEGINQSVNQLTNIFEQISVTMDSNCEITSMSLHMSHLLHEGLSDDVDQFSWLELDEARREFWRQEARILLEFDDDENMMPNSCLKIVPDDQETDG